MAGSSPSSTAPAGRSSRHCGAGPGTSGWPGGSKSCAPLMPGSSWTPPGVVADSDRDDRNIAFGPSPAGTLVLAYHRQGGYDDAGNYRPALWEARAERPIDVMVTRSQRCRPHLEPARAPRSRGVPHLLALREDRRARRRHAAAADLRHGDRVARRRARRRRAPRWFLQLPPPLARRRRDLGRTVVDRGRRRTRRPSPPSPVATCSAILRGSDADQALWSARSSDGGATWTAPAQITPPMHGTRPISCC